MSDWERHLCAPLTGRKVICAFEVLAGMTGQVAKLQRWGAQRPLLIADGRGTGPLPLETDADILLQEAPGAESLTEQVRARVDVEQRLTPEVIAAVERYDPDGAAVWWVSPVGPNEPMLGRPVLGGRPTTQIRLEDKLLLDAVLDAVGAPKAPSETAPTSYAAALAASERVAAATGSRHVVWAGDNRDGVNGGGDYIRVLDLDRPEPLAGAAVDFFAEHCDLIRVSPMLAGVPCSIHGLVLPDGVVALRPVELVNLLRPESGTFFYGGMATSWDPPRAETEAMRDLVRSVGVHLNREHGLRGAFGIDGVLTTDGFRVTEINPRFSGGLTRLSNTAPDLHLDLVQINALLDRDIGRAAADIEAEAMQSLTDRRIVDLMGLSTAAADGRHDLPAGAAGRHRRSSAAGADRGRCELDRHCVARGCGYGHLRPAHGRPLRRTGRRAERTTVVADARVRRPDLGHRIR